MVDQINEEMRLLPKLSRKEVIYWLESFRNGNVEDKQYQKKLIQNFLRAIYLYDDHIKITFDFDEDDTGMDWPVDSMDDSEESDCVLINTSRVYHLRHRRRRSS